MLENYTLENGLHVHPNYISRTGEDGRAVQERCWATVALQTNQAHLHQCVNIETLQAMFRGFTTKSRRWMSWGNVSDTGPSLKRRKKLSRGRKKRRHMTT